MFKNIPILLLNNNTPVEISLKKKNKLKVKQDLSNEKNDEIIDFSSISPFELITQSIAISLSDTNFFSKYLILHKASMFFLAKNDDSVTDRFKSSTYISLLDQVCTSMLRMLADSSNGSGSGSDSSAIIGGLLCCTALNTSLIVRYLKICDSQNSKINESVITALRNIINNASTTGIADINGEKSLKKNLENVPDLITEGSKNILSSDIGGRIILTVLSAKNPLIAALAGPCLGKFYGKYPSLILFQIALNSETVGCVQCDDLRPYFPLTKIKNSENNGENNGENERNIYYNYEDDNNSYHSNNNNYDNNNQNNDRNNNNNNNENSSSKVNIENHNNKHENENANGNKNEVNNENDNEISDKNRDKNIYEDENNHRDENKDKDILGNNIIETGNRQTWNPNEID